MTYLCDVCSTEMASQAQGKFFPQQEVLLSPSYWEFVIERFGMLGDIRTKVNAYGMFVQKFLADTSGFTVCNKCATMLNGTPLQHTQYGLDSYLARSGKTGPEPVLAIAGSVWERKVGDWPTCISNDIKRKRDAATGRKPDAAGDSVRSKKWWQFWK